jgi:enamine deaminase RidA (YjgF/YER057c/UK114 family)
MGVAEKLLEMNIELPEAPSPIASYVTYRRMGRLIFLSGQGPIIDRSPKYTGRVGSECSPEEAYDAARACGLNLLAILKDAIGDFEKVKQIVSLHGFIASAGDFYGQPAVLNGASELMVAVFGEKGRHSRCALGVNVLPGNIPVEVEMIVEVEE